LGSPEEWARLAAKHPPPLQDAGLSSALHIVLLRKLNLKKLPLFFKKASTQKCFKHIIDFLMWNRLLFCLPVFAKPSDF